MEKITSVFEPVSGREIPERAGVQHTERPRWLNVLSTAECFELLRRGHLGRVGVSIDALPVILPVVYRFDDDSIWFFTEEGTKLNAALCNAVVAFEIDQLDDTSGWSVLVIGSTSEEADVSRLSALHRDGLFAGAPGRRDHLVRIPISQVSGRSFAPGEQLGSLDGYL